MCTKMLLDENVSYILDTLKAAGYRADVVGGAVRDHLLGRSSFDCDITTSATPEEVKRVFAAQRLVDTGIKHGTVTLVLDGECYEITTWRVDGDYLDNRHPDSVTFTRSLAEDLARRDFTVNAICYNPTDGYTDMFGGVGDLSCRVIRAVGEPARRFDEDALRIMRAVRFCATLGFAMDKGTADAALSKRHLLQNVSAERIYAELKKLIAADGAYATLSEYGDILLTVLPELDALKLPVEERFASADPLTRLLSLFVLNSESPQDAFSTAMHRLKTDSATRILGEQVLSAYGISIKNRYDALRLLSEIGCDAARGALSLGCALGIYGDYECDILSDALACGVPYTVSALAIGGNELMTLGLRGREVGLMLSRLLDAVMRGECENSTEALLAYAVS